MIARLPAREAAATYLFELTFFCHSFCRLISFSRSVASLELEAYSLQQHQQIPIPRLLRIKLKHQFLALLPTKPPAHIPPRLSGFQPQAADRDVVPWGELDARGSQCCGSREQDLDDAVVTNVGRPWSGGGDVGEVGAWGVVGDVDEGAVVGFLGDMEDLERW